MMKTTIWAIMLFSVPAAALAQLPVSAQDTTATETYYSLGPRITSESKDVMEMSVSDYIRLHLPPLEVLLENARERSPQVNTFAAQRDFEDRELKTLRRSWYRYFKLNASFSYGTNDASSQIFYDNAQLPAVQNVTGSRQRWWNAGASFNLPLDEIFNRRNRIKQQESRVASIQYQVDSWYDEVCMKIIEAYTRAVQNLSVLNSVVQTMVIAKAQYTSAESNFINGKIDEATLNSQKSIENSAIREYEQVRSQLNTALLQLEVLSKTPIISKAENVVPNKSLKP